VLDEPIHLGPYQHEWVGAFLLEQKRLATTLGVGLVAIEHIGSTAVPGLSGKPIIDIMIGAGHLPPPAAWSEALINLGYEALGEAGVPGRLYFRLRTRPVCNVHLVEQNGTHWVNNLAFRDYLRQSPGAARQYEMAKYAAFNAGATTLVAYSLAKSAVVEALLTSALETKPGNLEAG
jgi:GrpB-like predicted nucleotidyltransferase (UPF0157 family)